MSEASGKIALVTGASRGIGSAIAIALAGAGADVAVNFKNREKEARETCSEIEGFKRRGIPVGGDVSVAADVSRIVQTVEKYLGEVAILVNNAGITRPQSLDKITEGIWDEVLQNNLKSSLFSYSGSPTWHACPLLGSHYQSFLYCGSIGRCCWTPLRGFQGRYHRIEPFLRRSSCQRRNYCQCDCSGTHRNGDGHQQPQCTPGPYPDRPIWHGGRSR